MKTKTENGLEGLIEILGQWAQRVTGQGEDPKALPDKITLPTLDEWAETVMLSGWRHAPAIGGYFWGETALVRPYRDPRMREMFFRFLGNWTGEIKVIFGPNGAIVGWDDSRWWNYWW